MTLGPKLPAAALVLADGSVFEGYAIGADRPISQGEVVFNTAMSGYQEVLSDPSYAGQIVTFTYPHIGSYGTTPLDNEKSAVARPVACRGVVVRDFVPSPSNWRSTQDLDGWLKANNVAGITGVDTRRLTKILRETGAVAGSFGTASLDQLRAAATSAATTDGMDYVQEVTTSEQYTVDARALGADQSGAQPLKIVAYDFGIKTNILRHLAQIASEVIVVPAATTAEHVLSLAPDGVFLSNGPGDPAALAYAVAAAQGVLGQVPMFGICLGHQLLGTALGATTFKLPFGHHGANHPVRDLLTSEVMITSQNHNYCVDPETFTPTSDAEITQLNLNDQTVEGLRTLERIAFSVQYHPEAAPGPREAAKWFLQFQDMAVARRDGQNVADAMRAYQSLARKGA
jgi:carbamoyl-phosphate synthase small subunit